MNDETTGWVIIHRKICDNKLWLCEPFTKAQAWLDLVINANHKEKYVDIRGNLVQVKRGQLGWSEITMSKRWRWSRNKVRRFLFLLKTEQQIEQQTTAQTSTITILNYETYQNTKQQTKQQKDNRKTTDDTQPMNVMNEKNKNTNTKYSSLEKIDSSDKDEIAKTYGVSLTTVEDEYENLKLYCESKGVSYKNYKAALINFIKRSKRTTSNNATLII